MNEKWKNHLKADPTPWLLESNPYTRYRTMVDLLEMPPATSESVQAKEELLAAEHFQNGLFTCRQELPEKGKGFAKPDPDSKEIIPPAGSAIFSLLRRCTKNSRRGVPWQV